MSKVGIMGGTFNPIHLGHLMIAEVACESFNLEKVIFVPAKIPPHKQHDVIDSRHRYAMTAAAVSDNPNFEISDVEMRREGPSYTVDTIQHFKVLYGPNVEFYFIAGTDTIRALPTWKFIEELLDEVHFIGATRPDGSSAIDETLAILGPKACEKIHLMEVPEMKLSATYLRERLRSGKTVRYMLPKCVVEYIEENHIYGKEEGRLAFDEIQLRVSQWLSLKRFKHTLGVVESATHLAKLYGVDVEKARLAALLHDCAKELPLPDMQNLVKSESYDADQELLSNGNLLHGLAGMIRAKKEFSISDDEVLEAIRVHTTGKVHMSKLDKVIFLADYIEPNRDFPGVDELRNVSELDLDKAVLLGFDNTIIHLIEQNLSIYPLTILGRNDVLQSCK